MLSKVLLSIDTHKVNEDKRADKDDENIFFQFKNNENIYIDNPLDLFLKSNNNCMK